MEEEYEKADHVGNLKTQLNARNCKVIIAALRGLPVLCKLDRYFVFGQKLFGQFEPCL